jgi:serine/threonine protein kinase
MLKDKYSHSFYALVFFQFYNARIADFGLAALVPSADESQAETHLMGTYGYAAPEVYATGNFFFLMNP